MGVLQAAFQLSGIGLSKENFASKQDNFVFQKSWGVKNARGQQSLTKRPPLRPPPRKGTPQALSLANSLSGPVLRDTASLSQWYPSIARYGVFGVSTWPIWWDTPSPFSERFPLSQHAKWRCDSSPSKRVSQRYLRDTLWKQGKWVRYPPFAILSRKGIARYGGLSRTGLLS